MVQQHTTTISQIYLLYIVLLHITNILCIVLFSITNICKQSQIHQLYFIHLLITNIFALHTLFFKSQIHIYIVLLQITIVSPIHCSSNRKYNYSAFFFFLSLIYLLCIVLLHITNISTLHCSFSYHKHIYSTLFFFISQIYLLCIVLFPITNICIQSQIHLHYFIHLFVTNISTLHCSSTYSALFFNLSQIHVYNHKYICSILFIFLSQKFLLYIVLLHITDISTLHCSSSYHKYI